MDRGSGVFVFDDRPNGATRSVRVHYHRPAGHGSRDPILLAMHGFDRAAAYFRNCWVEHAESSNTLVIAPEFDSEQFPGTSGYNYGNVKPDRDGPCPIEPRNRWTFGLVDRAFTRVKELACSERSGFALFGHSAGAQFAHRYLALREEPLADLVVSGNAGWWMLPDTEAEYPAGVGGTGLGEHGIRRYLSRRHVVLLGDADTDEREAGLPRNPEAVAQGPHRLARGRFYYGHCERLARDLAVPFGWSLVIAPGVGHDDAQIAGAAAEVVTRA